MKKYKRKKAVLGLAAATAIGAGVSLLGGILGSASSSSAQKKMFREQQKQQNRADTYATAQNLTAAYANQDYVKDFYDRITYAYGGRKKADVGATTPSANIWTPIINGVSSGLNSAVTGAINASATKNSVVKSQGNMYASPAKTELEKPDYFKTKQTGYKVPVNTAQLNNLPTRDKITDPNDLDNIRPSSVANSQYQFSPMQLFYLGGLNRQFCRR